MQSKVNSKLKETDLAYIAGLFDGEGCIHWFTVKKIYRYPSVTISMTTHAGLDLIIELFGGKLAYRIDKRPRNKPVYRWTVGNRKALNFLETIRPWLREKASQADMVFEFYKDLKGRICPGCGSPIDEERPRDAVYCTNKCYHKHRYTSLKSQTQAMQNRLEYKAL